jgi:hypothetical protein
MRRSLEGRNKYFRGGRDRAEAEGSTGEGANIEGGASIEAEAGLIGMKIYNITNEP